MRRTRAWLVAGVLLVSCAHETSKTPPPKDNEESAEKGAAATGAPTEAQEASGVQVAPSQPTNGPAAKPLPPKIKIIVRARGAEKTDKVFVFWGKKKLGETPVTLERPRDSGPVDLVVRSEGFFPVHTRAYTFRNDVVYVKLTKLDDRMTLFGAKRDANEPPPGSTPDGGAPPLPTLPTTPTPTPAP
ncbi:MAG TPA: hypothetical protein VF334_16545 [Polyangia bacterium]